MCNRAPMEGGSQARLPEPVCWQAVSHAGSAARSGHAGRLAQEGTRRYTRLRSRTTAVTEPPLQPFVVAPTLTTRGKGPPSTPPLPR